MQTSPSRKSYSPRSAWLKVWRGKLQLIELKNASESSVLVLPAPLMRKGISPAAVNSSSGTVEQKKPTTFPPRSFHA